jgi:alcohol dehydrogenase class IV
LVAEAAGIDLREMSIEQAAKAAINAVRKLIQDLGCPARLRDVGVKESDLLPLAEAVMAEVPMFENPQPIKSIEEIMGILREAW